MRKPRQLFNDRVLKSELGRHLKSNGDVSDEQLSCVKNWNERVESGSLISYSETQLEQAYLDAIFVDVLGYQPIGRGASHNLVPKRTAPTGRDYPDFVLGEFTPGAGIERWVVVGEIKPIGKNLDVPQKGRYFDETPVEQAFRYARHGGPGVQWIIVTNISEIRLYRNGYVDAYKKWNLSELTKKDRLSEFVMMLGKESVIATSGTSLSQSILDLSLRAGLALTEGFYGLYGIARAQLIKELVKSKIFSGASIAHLYGKAHKILNRGLFCAFCEDHSSRLLPAGTLQSVQAAAAKGKRKGRYWRKYLGLFGELDKGSPPGSANGFHAFNGGLFAHDPEIDVLQLPDSLFRRTFHYKARGKQSREIQGIYGFHVYDFNLELDVDALGAIFEQSLKDLPAEKMSVRGKGAVEVTDRETKGVYYTPREITNYMLDAVGKEVFKEMRSRADERTKSVPVKGKRPKRGHKAMTVKEIREAQFLDEMFEELRKFKVLDPACGSGAFLIEALELLRKECSSINSAIGHLRGAHPLFGLDQFILRNNIHGFDILEESTELAKLSIWLRTASQKEPLEDLKKSIVVKDSLRSRAYEKFDAIVSNPPWGAELEDWSDEALLKKFPECGEEKDSYAIFMILAHRLLKDGGVLSFVMPNSWLTTLGYEDLRRWMLARFEILQIVNVWKIFKDVNHDACIVILKKRLHTSTRKRRSGTLLRALPRGGTEAGKCERLSGGGMAARISSESGGLEQGTGR